MADPRFFQRTGPHTLAALAARVQLLLGLLAQLAVAADGERLIEDVAPLETAGPADVTYLDNRKYVTAFANSRAGAAFVSESMIARAPAGMALLVSRKPYKAFARAVDAACQQDPRLAGRLPTTKGIL